MCGGSREQSLGSDCSRWSLFAFRSSVFWEGTFWRGNILENLRFSDLRRLCRPELRAVSDFVFEIFI